MLRGGKIISGLMICIAIMTGLVSVSYGMSPQDEKRLFSLLGEIKGQLVQVNRRMDDLNRRVDDLNRRINDLRSDMNARFEQVDKRFEQVDKRFEQVDKRFEQVDKRFEEIDKRFEQVNKRIDDTNVRIEEVNHSLNARIEETNKNMRWLGLIMAGLVAAVIGIVVWDRRTAVRVAVKEAKTEMERDYELGLPRKILEVLREKAKSDRDLAAILRNFGLL